MGTGAQAEGTDTASSTQILPAGPASAGEEAFLQNAGVAKADPKIRQLVDSEAQAESDAIKDNLYNKILFWQTQPPPGVVVDAKAEQQRLQENASLGKPLTQGPTPVIVRRKRAMLEGIFLDTGAARSRPPGRMVRVERRLPSEADEASNARPPRAPCSAVPAHPRSCFLCFPARAALASPPRPSPWAAGFGRGGGESPRPCRSADDLLQGRQRRAPPGKSGTRISSSISCSKARPPWRKGSSPIASP